MWVIPYIKVKWKRHWPKLLIVTVTLLLIHPLRFSESWLSTRGLGAQDIPGVLIPNAALSPLYMAKCQLSMDQLALWTPPGPRDKTQRLKVTKGGTWRPDSCQPRYDTTVVVPFRNRAEHLEAFLLRMHPFLQAQNMSYSIFVVEQLPGKLFNRAKLFNVGALEAQKMRKNLKQCFIFHDVDLLPLNAQNLYACSRLPTHLSTFVDTFRFNLPYTTLFGGAIAISQDTFQAVNGFSNRFSGWGGEDDDFWMNRLSPYTNKAMVRYDNSIAKYEMLHHTKESPSEDRFVKLQKGRFEVDEDGLNNANYSVVSLVERELYTHILVAL